jgi:tRNA/tmRNA/rRNA uracil-C5-methylase (TrmA/RlmC/RlmD family)
MAELPMSVGEQLDVSIGAVAHGGHCVARVGDDPAGPVVFVRHALPGERVRAVITELHPSYARADAIEILQPSPDRVPPPCPHAGPARCGGCDWQHASAPAQRRLKALVVHEQFQRIAGLDVTALFSGVEELPGGLLGWRTRTAYAVDAAGHLGLRRHRSHDVERMDACPIGVAGVGDHPALRRSWPGYREIVAIQGSDGTTTLLGYRQSPRRSGRSRRGADLVEVIDGPARLPHHVGGHDFQVDAAGFWQVHPAAASALAAAILSGLRPQPGEVVLDLYAGAGLFAALLAEAVGEAGRVVAVEGSRQAAADARANLRSVGPVRADVWADEVSAATIGGLTAGGVHPDLVVLDPPRAGAGAAVIRAILATEPRLVGYVSCDPATLARDVRVAGDAGWRLGGLRAFDAFPMTHHVECVAILTRAGQTT